LAGLTPFHHLARVTCEYRHFRGGAHHIFGERPRERGDFLEVKARVLARHADRLRPDVLARAVDTLRTEIVDEREGRASAGREVETLRDALSPQRTDLESLAVAHQVLARERFAWEERFHAVNGELAGSREESERRAAELQRLYDEERKLRAAVEDQTAHLGRTYAEIERLNRLIREMEATRAWRLHRWWHS